MIVAPQRRNRSTTVDLPAAMLPVRATFSTEANAECGVRNAESTVAHPFRISHSAFHIQRDRKSTRLNSSHTVISYAVFCLKKKNSWRGEQIDTFLLVERANDDLKLWVRHNADKSEQ